MENLGYYVLYLCFVGAALWVYFKTLKAGNTENPSDLRPIDPSKLCYTEAKKGVHDWKAVCLLPTTAEASSKIVTSVSESSSILKKATEHVVCIKCGLVADIQKMLSAEHLTALQNYYTRLEEQKEQKAIYIACRENALANLHIKYPSELQWKIALAGFETHENLVDSLPSLLELKKTKSRSTE